VKGQTRVTVTIAGEEYTIKGNESAQYIEELARFVDKKIAEIQTRYPRLSKNKAIVLASLNIADEMFKLQVEQNELMRIIEEEMK
jgi:cell division protein ZapA